MGANESTAHPRGDASEAPRLRQELVKEVLTRVWHAPMLHILSEGPTRYVDFRTKLIKRKGSSPGDGYISTVLRELRSLELAEQQQIPESRRRVWVLTDLGKAVEALIEKFDDLTELETSPRHVNDLAVGSPPTGGVVATVGRHSASRPWGMSMDELEARALRIDTTTAHPARRYDYLLGGKNNFKADRDSAHEIEAVMPTIKLAAVENRRFLQRAVRFLSAQGVRQFLDVGTGIPTSPNTHEIAQELDPTSRIVYVDNDPIVLTHARALLASAPQGRTAYIDGDLRQPQAIVESPELLNTLDLSQPVGLLLVAVLHFIRDDEDPEGIVETLVDALPPGSWVVASHATWEYMPAEALPRLNAANRDGRFRARSGEELANLLRSLHLLQPGVQSVAQWWPEQDSGPRPAVADVAINGAVGRTGRTTG